MSTPSTPESATDLKLVADILARQQMQSESRERGRKVRWSLFLVALAFFVVSRYVLLRSQYSQVFEVFQKGGDANYSCLASNNANPWNIVLNVASPPLARLANALTFFQQPLSQDQATFLWDAIRGLWIPTQKQIDSDEYSKGMGLSPLSYLCGNVLSVWQNATGKTIDDLKRDPSRSPWHWYLSTKSKILGEPESLHKLTTEGLWGISIWLGTSKGARDLYEFVYGAYPSPSRCPAISRLVNVASLGATFAMAGSAFGAPGALIGGIGGLTLGLLQDNNDCGKIG